MPTQDTKPPFAWPPDLGAVLHLLEIAVLLISIGVSYEKFNAATDQVKTNTVQLNRMEHYLSSKDANYWRLSREDQ